jgi:hypothetical protein
LGKALLLTADQFAELVSTDAVLLYWLGLEKYQASRAFTFAPISSYTPQQQARITETSVFDNWHLILPPRELDRLRRAYDVHEGAATSRKLDCIVLTRMESHITPDTALFVLSYANPTFRVYTRRE